MLLSDVKKSSCGEGDVGRLYSSEVRAVDWQSKEPGSNPGTVKGVSFATERF